MPSILICAADLLTRNLLQEILTEPYQLYIATTIEEVNPILSEVNIDLLLLDIITPNFNSLQIIKEVSQQFTLSILMLLTNNNEHSRIKAFDAGVDQCLAKPFNNMELLMRVKSLLRRTLLTRSTYKTQISTERFRQAIEEVPFTNTENGLMNHLIKNKNKTVSKEELQRAVLRTEYSILDRNLDMHISNMRRKLKSSGFSKDVILTIRNKGYLFEEKRDNLSKVNFS
ncbi:response regulator transcription factor [Colwellia sp. E2M01]|uniref:response regulator transcription factor n=1 Tax=Colwellia sp. E2M01 TaxID=2841561 RepID=UPI001C08DC79|nr:response regulator transcription factor [Colwellia sp. E2M01]MBU2870549.1 response regulator transcription factor [Colwellia sp. E2M01]